MSTPRLILWSLLVSLALLVFWSPLLFTPFWQDDFTLLYLARQAQTAGDAWYSSFFPRQLSIFWRPLSEGVYWRMVEGRLDADPAFAHALNLGILAASALTVGWLAGTLTRMVAPQADAASGGLLGALLYGIHGAHLLPVAWATAVHTSMAVLFSALALRFWIAGLRPSGQSGGPGVLVVPLFFLLALFSKESAVLAAPIAVLLTFWVWPGHRPSRAGWAVMATCALIAVAWLLIRKQVTVPPADAYEMTVGANVARNGISLILFFFNVPREALRFVLTEQSVAAGLWGTVCFLLQALAFWLLARAAPGRLGGKGISILTLFFLVSCAPYFVLAWNTYAYYITLSLAVWPIVAALSGASRRAKTAAVISALLSSGLAVAGNLALDYPALLARASWAERQLATIRAQLSRPPERLYVYVRPENRHKYLGFGPHGLAYALDIERERIIELSAGDALPTGSTMLIIPADGDVRILKPDGHGAAPHTEQESEAS